MIKCNKNLLLVIEDGRFDIFLIKTDQEGKVGFNDN